MEYELRIIVEKVACGNGEVVKRETIIPYEIRHPESILDLGLRQIDQISLLEKVQNVILAEQTILIDLEPKDCPKCGGKIKKNGYKESDFHTVFSDHQLKMQKYRCCNPECDWLRAPTAKSLFGTNIHPDLAKLQCEQGALYSYRKAESNLEALNGKSRPINNHTRIKRISGKVGEILSQKNAQQLNQGELPNIVASELIVQVDGGHIPIQDKSKRSFEALSAIIYKAENLMIIDKNHSKITEKTCVVSAQADGLKTIKSYVINAAKKQGLGKTTKVIALADGAKNCWSVLLALQPYCQSIECILDWFHIANKFQNTQEKLGESFQKSLDSIKWEVWHGHVEKALTKLNSLLDNLTGQNLYSSLQKLYEYLKENEDYLVNYAHKKETKQTYTSLVAESHIDSLINQRHKKDRKMQWTRQGAHQILQIRAMMASQQWENQWLENVLLALGVATS